VAKAESSVANMSAGNVTAKIGGWPARLKAYFGELQVEMRAVTWPNWKQVRSTTIVVLVAVFAFAGYFFLVDLVLGRAIQRVFETFTR